MQIISKGFSDSTGIASISRQRCDALVNGTPISLLSRLAE
jgi:hypothetical protein